METTLPAKLSDPPAVESSITVEEAVDYRGLFRIFASCLFSMGFPWTADEGRRVLISESRNSLRVPDLFTGLHFVVDAPLTEAFIQRTPYATEPEVWRNSRGVEDDGRLIPAKATAL